MWPVYFVLNKILNVEAEKPQKEEGSKELLNAEECHHIEPSTSNWECHKVLPCSRFIQVPHINQLNSWDCGLACVLMALNTIGITDCSIQSLADACNTTSIWTVDLAYVLQKFSVRFSYFTVTLGANPNYSAETFYKEQLPNDLVRVDTLFRKAVDEGINIQVRSINEKEISRLILSGHYIAIALVDQYKLRWSWVEDVILSGMSSRSSYTGHYVLICGYDAVTDEFEIRDPASSRKDERISSKCLEESRKSFGTDEDLLLIHLDESSQHLDADH
ncbi:hypothetical protein K2173_004970 [Erythroxylum novogranatense]|uniref:Guanylyl cyclase n=1 Tax=Erythroxylum novogranatense TaxID=1862640 RepID=A0AAV8TBJ0_9ROSI|nr:hypothetical protein K2173_004970 [Erythroxylum novogranatense]